MAKKKTVSTIAASTVTSAFAAMRKSEIYFPEEISKYFIRYPMLHMTFLILGIGALAYICHRILKVILKSTVFSKSITPLLVRGEWAIVTGATDGIGKEIAMVIAEQKLKVLVVGRNETKLFQVITELNSFHGLNETYFESLLIDFDTSEDDVYTKIHKKIKNLDIGIVVNNVGISYPHAMYYDELETEFIDTLLNVNLRTTMRITHMIYKDMKMKKRGLIVNIASGAALLPTSPLYVAYSTVKAAVIEFSKSLQEEAAEFNIAVQCFTPLLVATKMSKIRKHSYFVPSPRLLAQEILEHMLRAQANVKGCIICPHFAHRIQIYFSQCLSPYLWSILVLRKFKKARKRYLNKNMASERTNSVNLKKNE